jgi:hypothetical protein
MHRRAKAWSLWISAAIVLAGVATAAVSFVGQRRPHSARTDPALHLPIGDLRSHAEEGRLLVRIARADELTPTFTREHARQLARRVQAALDDLPKPADASKPGIDAANAATAANDARRARRSGENVQRALQRIVAAPRPADELDAAEPVFAAAARELGFLDTATQEQRK